MKKFTVINEEFICQNCGKKVNKLKGSCRNHCNYCLYSLHLDKEFPGDRQSNCKGLMEAVKLDQNSKKGWIILHKCKKCKKTIKNKAAEDDDLDQLIQLSQI